MYKFIATFLIAIMASLSMPVLADTYYQWVDEDGNVHFGQRPPQGSDVDVEVKTTETPDYIDADAAAAAEDEEEDETSEEASEDDEETEETAAEEPVFKKDPELCKKARAAKQTLEQNALVRQDGRILTLEEKNEQIQNANALIQQHCN